MSVLLFYFQWTNSSFYWCFLLMLLFLFHWFQPELDFFSFHTLFVDVVSYCFSKHFKCIIVINMRSLWVLCKYLLLWTWLSTAFILCHRFVLSFSFKSNRTLTFFLYFVSPQFSFSSELFSAYEFIRLFHCYCCWYSLYKHHRLLSMPSVDFYNILKSCC